MTSLFAIATEYRSAALKLADLDMDAQTIADTLEGMSGELEVKAQNVAHMVRSIEADAAAVAQWGKDAAARAPDFIEDFYRRLGMPVRLRDAKIPQTDIDHIADEVMGDFYLHQNARKIRSKSEITDMLHKRW